jgi:AcrR family transcriptional regulator
MADRSPRRPEVSLDTAPPTRAAQQQRTRDALVQAAYQVFARDGFHGASLDAIAGHAGYSKGAVYSNFASKGELFLAVMDETMAPVAAGGDWDPLDRSVTRDELDAVADLAVDDPPTPAQLARGFGLATLEFVSTAGRDQALSEGLRDRLGVLVDAYRRAAATRRSDDEQLGDDELAFVLAAFDQGYALFALIGWPIEDLMLLQRGLGRLLQPTPDEVTR